MRAWCCSAKRQAEPPPWRRLERSVERRHAPRPTPRRGRSPPCSPTIISPRDGPTVRIGTVIAQRSRKLITDVLRSSKALGRRYSPSCSNAAIGGGVIATAGISRASKPLVCAATRERLAVVAAVTFGVYHRPPGSSRGSLYGISAALIRLRRRISALSIAKSTAANSINRSQKKDAS